MRPGGIFANAVRSQAISRGKDGEVRSRSGRRGLFIVHHDRSPTNRRHRPVRQRPPVVDLLLDYEDGTYLRAARTRLRDLVRDTLGEIRDDDDDDATEDAAVDTRLPSSSPMSISARSRAAAPADPAPAPCASSLCCSAFPRPTETPGSEFDHVALSVTPPTPTPFVHRATTSAILEPDDIDFQSLLDSPAPGDRRRAASHNDRWRPDRQDIDFDEFVFKPRSPLLY
ncbi:Uncharacterized protein PBTT_06988 [Plasmodiophora brassicae]